MGKSVAEPLAVFSGRIAAGVAAAREARDICESPAVMATFAAVGWDDMGADCREWITAIVAEAVKRERARLGCDPSVPSPALPETGPMWVDRAAWVADVLIPELMRAHPGVEPCEDPDNPLSPAHLMMMAKRLRSRELKSDTKACRWLGWLQAGAVATCGLTLDQMKRVNEMSGGPAA